ncbi:uncharacterized protein BCR38DRAFT_413975 [Pseudomassariella vexata]|uniref:Uncharacterized protein n=1 Tax=Pseudomassariella vexata TaxID=1141098 RepID=A0A1Y2DE90_9PEZI|nr:uncharacterized protein BCR38DRAFT_413975 [Pseudomassariella vexata]ORY57590.1 hypothetical protein BCR38DRAFT_413975 [Pseudomassariella vexata]
MAESTHLLGSRRSGHAAIKAAIKLQLKVIIPPYRGPAPMFQSIRNSGVDSNRVSPLYDYNNDENTPEILYLSRMSEYSTTDTVEDNYKSRPESEDRTSSIIVSACTDYSGISFAYCEYCMERGFDHEPEHFQRMMWRKYIECETSLAVLDFLVAFQLRLLLVLVPVVLLLVLWVYMASI